MILFYPLDAMLARYLRHRVSVCLSVCPSVRPSQVGVLLRRLNLDYANNAIRQLKESSFLLPKISAKLERRHPSGGAKRGWVC